MSNKKRIQKKKMLLQQKYFPKIVKVIIECGGKKVNAFLEGNGKDVMIKCNEKFKKKPLDSRLNEKTKFNLELNEIKEMDVLLGLFQKI